MVVDEKGTEIWKDKWEDSRVFGWRGYIASIHENVFPTTVSMEIAEDRQLSLFCKVMDHLLSMVDSWMQHFWRSLPSSVQITSCQRASVVAIDHPIWIEHWDHFEHKILSQQLCFRRCRIAQEVKSSSHHPGTYWFSWMDSCCYNHTLSFCHVLLVLLTCNREYVELISCQSLAKCSSLSKLRFHWVLHNLAQVIL